MRQYSGREVLWPGCDPVQQPEEKIVEPEVAEKKAVADEDPTAVEPEEADKKTITNGYSCRPTCPVEIIE